MSYSRRESRVQNANMVGNENVSACSWACEERKPWSDTWCEACGLGVGLWMRCQPPESKEEVNLDYQAVGFNEDYCPYIYPSDPHPRHSVQLSKLCYEGAQERHRDGLREVRYLLKVSISPWAENEEHSQALRPRDIRDEVGSKQRVSETMWQKWGLSKYGDLSQQNSDSDQSQELWFPERITWEVVGCRVCDHQ